MEVKKIYKYGLAYIKNNSLLLCEPYAFSDLILPGGIIENNESYVENLTREITEELGENAVLDISSLKYLDTFSDEAAGRKNVIVEIKLYLGNVIGELHPSNEIKKLIWFGTEDDTSRLSAIIRNRIYPYLLKGKHIIK